MEVLACTTTGSLLSAPPGWTPGIPSQPTDSHLSASSGSFVSLVVSPSGGRANGRRTRVPAGNAPRCARWQCGAAGPRSHPPTGPGSEGFRSGQKRTKGDGPIVGRAISTTVPASAGPLEDDGKEELEAWEKAPLAEQHHSSSEIAQGFLSLVVVERVTAGVVEACRFPFPAPVLMLAGIAAAMALNTEATRQFYDFHSGAVAFFDAWLPMFFVPSVAGIALAPMPAGADLIKAALVLGGSYAFNLWATGKLAIFVQGMLKSKHNPIRAEEIISHDERLARIGRAANAWTKSLAQRGAKALSSVAERTAETDVKQATTAASRFLAQFADTIEVPKTLAPLDAAVPSAALLGGTALLLPFLLVKAANPWLMTPGFMLLTMGLFTKAKGLPPAVRKWLSPTVVGGATIALLTATYGASNLGSWQQGVRLYKEGAGAILAMLIGPAVASLGFKVHTQRTLLKKSATQLALVCLLIVPIGLVATALIGRILGASLTVTASLLPATTTLGLAREMGPLLGANHGLLVAGVTIAGTAGISTARQLMEHWKIEGAAHRGMAVGASSHTLGASAIAADEPQAAAVAGLTLALKGTIAVIAISLPSFRNLLLAIANPA